MTISFDKVPSNLRTPFVAAEISNANASQGPALLAYKALIIGQKLASASGIAANTLQRVTSANQVALLAGRGSMLHRMAKAFFAKNTSTECWIGALDDSSAAALSQGSLTVSGPATASGTAYLYIGGQRIAVGVSTGDSSATIAAALAAAIGKHASGTVTFASAVAAEVVNVDGTAFTAVSGAATPGAATFSIDTSDTATAASFVSQVKAHAVAGKKVFGSSALGIATLLANAGGTPGNALTLAKTASGSHIVVSGATLAGATADQDLGVHAQASGSVVTTYAKNAGLVANETDMRANYNDGEAFPAGVSIAFSAMAGGTSNPSLSALIAAMGDIWFNVIANPFTDATSLSALENELDDRFGPMRMIDGSAITASAVGYSPVATLGESRNSQHNTLVRAGGSPTTPEECSGHVMGAVAFESAIDPARPLQTVSLPYILPPALADQDTLQERNLLLFDGVSTIKDVGGQMQIDRLITTYQENAVGAPDTSYLNLETMRNLSYLRYSFRVFFALKYPRHKLAADGFVVGPGQAVLTPKDAKAAAVSWFIQMQTLGLVQNVDAFKANVSVEINAQNPDRLDILLPPKLIAQLINTAASIQFQN